MSFFKYERIAEGYSKYRPYYHPIIINKIKDKFNIQSKVNLSLDVGCGAGLSSKALLAISKNVIGIDESEEMIKVAKKANKDIKFYKMSAEKIDIEDTGFDILTVCGAINWINRKKFLPEASRLLKPDGIMIIYDNFICGHIDNNSKYSDWYQNEFLKKYPKPYRNEDPFTQKEVSEYSIKYINEELYNNNMLMSVDEFTDFILTQSNIINAVEMGNCNIKQIREWFISSLIEIFPDNKMHCKFEGFIWYFKKDTGKS